MDEPSPCALCGIPDSRRAEGLTVDAGNLWTFNVATDAHAGGRPWIVLQPKRHVPRIDLLTPAEQAQLTTALARATRHLAADPQVRRVHVQLLNEAEPPHVHFHVSVSYTADESAGPTSFLTAPPPGVAPAPLVEWLPPADEATAAIHEPSGLVRRTLTAVHGVRRALGMDWYYRKLLAWVSRRFPRADSGTAGEVLVVGWVLLLGLGAFASTRGHAIAVAMAVVAGYRLADMVTYTIIEVVDRNASRKRSFERTFVLTGLNLVQVVLACFIWFSVIATPDVNSDGAASGFERLWASFAIVTLRGGDLGGSSSVLLIDAAGTIVSAFLLLVVLGVILGSLAARLYEHEGKTDSGSTSTGEGPGPSSEG